MPVRMRISTVILVGLAGACLLLVAGLVWTPQAHNAQAGRASTHAATCRESRLPPMSGWPLKEDSLERHLRLEVDVNGDGILDLLEVAPSRGSGFGGTDVQLTLGGSSTHLEAREEFAFTAITAINQVPKELLDPRHRDALAWIEEALFSTVCTSPDPSLAWLLDSTKRLRWIEGSPEIPGSYAIRLPARRVAGLLRVAYVPAEVSGGKIDPSGEVWLNYAGGVHAYEEMVELARRGERVLLGTAHGVILTNPKRSRHAWIYIYAGNLDTKLRFPSIAGARLQGDTAGITLNGWTRLSQVRVNLNTGAISK